MQKRVVDYFVSKYESFFFYALKKTSSFQDAEEVMQDAFLRMYAGKEPTVDNPVAVIKRHMAFAAADFYREWTKSRSKTTKPMKSLDSMIDEHRKSENSESDFSIPFHIQKALGVYDISDYDEREACSQVHDGRMLYLNAVEDRLLVDLAKSEGVSESMMCRRVLAAKNELKKLLAA